MTDSQEAEVIRAFKERVRSGKTRDVSVVYRVTGGMPAERHVEEELRISGARRAKARAREVAHETEQPPAEGEIRLDQAEIEKLFGELSEGVDGLVPRSEAAFLPDSLVGSVTIDVGGEEATLYFLADEDARAAQDEPMPRKTAAAVRDLDRLSERLLKGRATKGGS
jgi:hypothetical protein